MMRLSGHELTVLRTLVGKEPTDFQKKAAVMIARAARREVADYPILWEKTEWDKYPNYQSLGVVVFRPYTAENSILTTYSLDYLTRIVLLGHLLGVRVGIHTESDGDTSVWLRDTLIEPSSTITETISGFINDHNQVETHLQPPVEYENRLGLHYAMARRMVGLLLAEHKCQEALLREFDLYHGVTAAEILQAASTVTASERLWLDSHVLVAAINGPCGIRSVVGTRDLVAEINGSCGIRSVVGTRDLAFGYNIGMLVFSLARYLKRENITMWECDA